MTPHDDSASRRSRSSSELESQVGFLEAEVVELRRRLSDAPQATRFLEQRLAETQSALASLTSQNERLASTLREARDQIMTLKEEVDRLAQPPTGFGTFLGANDDDTVDVYTGGRKLRVNVSPSVEVETLERGQEVMLNEALNVVAALEFEEVGEVVMLKEILADGDRALVIANADEEKVVRIAEPLRSEKIRAGDSVLLDVRANYIYERIPKTEVEELVLEEVPDIDYANIGGLMRQIDQIRDAIELPYMHPELFQEHELKPPKGVLLYGPPGCGKTLIAKAVANSLAKKVAARTGEEGKSFFLNIKGPELLNKYVGETERHIRLVFQRAREKASEGTPVIVFFDEMDSLFRTRGSGVSSDVENTIVPQLLSEIDGVEGLENVIVIGASNREDMIDPAILRPGRLDVKIKIERPDAESARDIFTKYLTSNLPLHADDLDEFGGNRDACVGGMIQRTVERMYTELEENRFLEVTYANGDKEVLYFKDFNSGAMIQNIVDRAKKMAIKDLLDNDQRGIRVQHMLQACVDEFKENEDLPNDRDVVEPVRAPGLLPGRSRSPSSSPPPLPRLDDETQVAEGRVPGFRDVRLCGSDLQNVDADASSGPGRRLVRQAGAGSSSRTVTEAARRVASRGSNRPAPTDWVFAVPQATPWRRASSQVRPARRAASTPASSASPEPSDDCTFSSTSVSACRRRARPPSRTRAKQPDSRVMITLREPISAISSSASTKSWSDVNSNPTSSSASCWFGETRSGSPARPRSSGIPSESRTVTSLSFRASRMAPAYQSSGTRRGRLPAKTTWLAPRNR